LFNYIDQGGPQKWSDAIWPGKTAIPYCFATETDRIQLHERVEAAIKLWIDALGGERGTDNGHDLQFLEWYDFKAFRVQLCYDSRSNENRQWNHALPTTTLAIYLREHMNMGAKATMGTGSLADRNKPWKIVMSIGPGADASIVAHELGHVLGMFSRQRSNDTY
jgi:hypothetical protein